MIRRSGHDQADAFQQAWELHVAGRRRAPGATAELDGLVAATDLLVASASAAPSPTFRSSLREQLMAEAADVLVPVAKPERTAPARPVVQTGPSRARRRLTGVAVAAISSAGFVGLVATSAQALPGDTLYPVKRTVESVELAMHRDDASRGAYRLDLATERLAEAHQIASRPGGAGQVPGLLEEFSTQAEAGSAELFDSFGTTAAPGDVERVNEFTAAAALELGSMSEDVPEDARASLVSASAIVADLAGQAARLCGACHAPDVSALLGAPARPQSSKPAGTATTDGSDQQSASAPTKPDAGASAATSPRSTAGAGSTPSTSPSASAPTPSAKPTPEGLGRVLDPVVTTLFGDETSPGLVPGLVDGLLGGGSRP